MYPNISHVKEVNAYYARTGGIQTAGLRAYANADGFAGHMRKAALRAAAPSAQENQAATAARSHTAQTASAAYGRRTRAASSASSIQENTEALAEAAQSTDKSNGNACCEQCRLTSQLTLQMLSQSLYTQSGLGYLTGGTGSWLAYQNMANALNNSLFS